MAAHHFKLKLVRLISSIFLDMHAHSSTLSFPLNSPWSTVPENAQCLCGVVFMKHGVRQSVIALSSPGLTGLGWIGSFGSLICMFRASSCWNLSTAARYMLILMNITEQDLQWPWSGCWCPVIACKQYIKPWCSSTWPEMNPIHIMTIDTSCCLAAANRPPIKTQQEYIQYILYILSIYIYM